MRPPIELTLTQPALRHARIGMEMRLKDRGSARGVFREVLMRGFAVASHCIFTLKHRRAKRTSNNRLQTRILTQVLRLLFQESLEAIRYLKMSDGTWSCGDAEAVTDAIRARCLSSEHCSVQPGVASPARSHTAFVVMWVRWEGSRRMAASLFYPCRHLCYLCGRLRRSGTGPGSEDAELPLL